MQGGGKGEPLPQGVKGGLLGFLTPRPTNLGGLTKIREAQERLRKAERKKGRQGSKGEVGAKREARGEKLGIWPQFIGKEIGLLQGCQKGAIVLCIAKPGHATY